MPKLKVYRTPIGFHDAYVAAPSQKTALEAWGSDADLFARGIAEIVTDETLMAEPLASPGKVIRKLRGTADEQLEAAEMPDRPKPRPPADEDAQVRPRAQSSRRQVPRSKPAPPPPPPPPPRPSRAALDAAEQATKEAQARHADEDRDWRKREDALMQERRRLDAAHNEEAGRLAGEEDEARRAYEAAVKYWEAQN